MGVRVATDATVLFDSVTGLVIGSHIFEGGPEGQTAEQEADAFLRWVEAKLPNTVSDIRGLYSSEMSGLVTEWINLVAEGGHVEAVCPWDVDRDSYGLGFTGDSDKSRGDYTEATPDSCDCECHKREGGVFHPATRR